ncbi:dynamin family protein [Acidithiobacillus concretivorus]|uniref:50S ribosome-binding GTPase n=1 Tax=Acidithiobacillus concretivorus TaxID=3063952 RepID=A0ABS5ZNE8_9PROT|nr:dynamin family protein [Acidithiobacillus concretivorus]MBU2737688.1 50S ribosome-binding GTPase [Acidithiobacillus concretivorus]
MNQIEITHNPFTVDTKFLINGQPPAEGCKLSSYKESRLQIWVESLFDELNNLFNGEDDFHVIFTGVESDFLDIQAAAIMAKEKGIHADVDWISVQPAETRLEKIKELINEAKSHPQFGSYLDNNEKVRESLEEAFNCDFDVYVVATMSAGKSTLINAMLGNDLLPAANEATTATITRIIDDEQVKGKFKAKRFDEMGNILESEENIGLEKLKIWNQQEGTFRIDIEGDIVAIEKRDNVRLVLTDTPGPNNSQNDEHRRKTMEFIQDSRRNPLILYILNGTQLSTHDDKILLNLVAKQMSEGGKQSKDRFIFVVNKMDAFDPEKGEDPSKTLDNVRNYLKSNGILNPLVYPVSAYLTGLIRKPHDGHSRKERCDFQGLADLFSEQPCMNLVQYMPITSRVKRTLSEKKYTPLMVSSGLPAVEVMIDEYIDKYNLPHRLKRAYDALLQSIKVGLNEAHLIEQLNDDQKVLDQLLTEIQELKNRKKKSFDSETYKENINKDGKHLPQSTVDLLVKIEADHKNYTKHISERFDGGVDVKKANMMVREVEEDLNAHYQQLINEYEKAYISSQELIRYELENDYKFYVAELFDHCQNLNLPMLAGIKQTITDISVNLIVGKEDIDTKSVKTGSYEVSDSKWWNPFSWGSTKTRSTCEDQEFVDLKKFWQNHEFDLRNQYSTLQKSARKKIEKKKDDLVEYFLSFMEREFTNKFDELIASLESKVNDKDERVQAIEAAKQRLEWINGFKEKLDRTMSV